MKKDKNLITPESLEKNSSNPITVENNNMLLGIIGAILGALVGSIPWIISYVYLEYIFSVLSLVIGFGSYYGYKLFKGKMTKKVPLIISIISVLTIVVVTLVIIPLLLLIKEDLPANFTFLKLLYMSEDFKSAIIGDLIISLLFTIAGVVGIYQKIKSDLK